MQGGERRESSGLSAIAEAALQKLIDGFTRTVGRMGGFDDEHLKLLIYNNPPTAPTAGDTVHYHSALHRTSTAEVMEWVISWLRDNDIDRADHPRRLPANRGLAMVSRLCMPIRCDGAILGYLWVIDPNENLPDDHHELMIRVARSAALILDDDRRRRESLKAVAQEVLSDILYGSAEVSSRAVARLGRQGYFASEASASAIVVRYREPGDMDTAWATRALVAAAEDFVETLSPGLALKHTAPESTLIVVAPSDPILRNLDALGLGQLVLDTIEEDRLAPGSTEVGLSRSYPLPELRSAWLEAKRALDIGRRLRPTERVFAWSELGAYRLIGRFPFESISAEDLSASVAELLKEGRAEYRETLETYLDTAGDVGTTAGILKVHRATVYYRLHRIEQIIGTNLSDGDQLLELHLGLKLARIRPVVDGPAGYSDGGRDHGSSPSNPSWR